MLPNQVLGRRFRTLVTVAVLVALSLCGVLAPNRAHAGLNRWTTNGPGGGQVFALAIDLSTPTTAAAAGTGGVFKSTNSGTTWASVTDGLTNRDVRSLAIDPNTPTTLYAGTFSTGGLLGNVFKSTNGGASWTATSLVNVVGNAFGIQVLVAAPTTPTTLYAGGGIGVGSVTSGLFRSTDGGGSRTAILTNTQVQALVIDPTTPTTLYVGTYFGVFKSTDGGGSWVAANSGLPVSNKIIDALAIDPMTPTTVYVGTDSAGLFKSTTWDTRFACGGRRQMLAARRPAETLGPGPPAPAEPPAITA